MNPFSLALKAASWKAKLGIFAGIALMLLITHGAAFWVGLNKGKTISEVKIAKYEKDLADLRTKKVAAQVVINDKIRTVYVDRVRVEKEVQFKNNNIIRDNVISRDKTLANGWIYAHNQAVIGQLIDPVRAANDVESGVKDADALQVIARNLSTARLCATQNDGWKSWYAETKKMYDDFSAKHPTTEKK
jgi:hypothetical protein